MSAADDSGATGRRLADWFGWRPRQPHDEPLPGPLADKDTLGDLAIAEAGISALPDPVIALDRDGRVLAFNAAAAAVAPALRRGDPASIALRTPELVEAIRHANAQGNLQRVEFSDRVPTERHFEAFVSPIALAN